MSSPICPMPLGEIVRDMLGKEKETNPVKRLYDDAFKADIGRWIASCAVIGLSAGIMSKHPGHNLLAASAYNLAVIPVRPQGLSNPRPPIWYVLILALSTVMWLAALTVIFVLREDIDAYNESSLGKRRTGFVGDISTGTVAMLDNLSIACGCFGICAFLFCVYQWFVVHYLYSTRFKKTEMREGYRKIKKIEPPKDGPSTAV
ncbi:hypothetical protein FOXB_16257 [Fusarium oxysporum f. sp. conglutinans Fo5176]|uniref:Uncharacterized protein n=1 Tax=Fusarium oxysporum (strain Fo5176) TaxID=660025 RepID=F9GC74_FUSOF|nr:hypothetical protein FOXB_16257 [Fusarium oxysporum f. sp. conglutinans Fo5176]